MDYQSAKWKRKRERILRRDKYMSQLALRYGKLKEATVVHHIFPSEDYPEYQWSDWNLISISQDEHNQLHDRNTGKLTEKGRELLRRTAQKIDIEIDPPT